MDRRSVLRYGCLGVLGALGGCQDLGDDGGQESERATATTEQSTATTGTERTPTRSESYDCTRRLRMESASMEPNIQAGAQVCLVEQSTYRPADSPGEAGVVTARRGTEIGYESFGQSGDVIAYRPNGNQRVTPVLHRAMFWVEEADAWFREKADRQYVPDASESCDALDACPAPHSGYVTCGDANDQYDQVGPAVAVASIVRPEWIVGVVRPASGEQY